MSEALHIDDQPAIPRTVFEHDGFRAWALSGEAPSGASLCFVDGEVFIEMGPEATESHNKVKTELTRALAQIVIDGNLGESYSDGTLLTHPDAGLSAEPDFLFATWDAFTSGRLSLVEKAGRKGDYVELVGSPDLVVEVVSDASQQKDTVRLRNAYARAAIAEYWLIDARAERMHFEILRREAGVYVATPGEAQRSEVFGRSFGLERHQNPLGRWAYHLRQL